MIVSDLKPGARFRVLNNKIPSSIIYLKLAPEVFEATGYLAVNTTSWCLAGLNPNYEVEIVNLHTLN